MVVVIQIQIQIQIQIILLFELQYKYNGVTEYKTKGRVLKVPRPYSQQRYILGTIMYYMPLSKVRIIIAGININATVGTVSVPRHSPIMGTCAIDKIAPLVPSKGYTVGEESVPQPSQHRDMWEHKKFSTLQIQTFVGSSEW